MILLAFILNFVYIKPRQICINSYTNVCQGDWFLFSLFYRWMWQRSGAELKHGEIWLAEDFKYLSHFLCSPEEFDKSSVTATNDVLSWIYSFIINTLLTVQLAVCSFCSFSSSLVTVFIFVHSQFLHLPDDCCSIKCSLQNKYRFYLYKWVQ